MSPRTEKIDTIKEDFSGDVWCLFGLPVDNLSLKTTIAKLERQIENNRQQVLSTININWITTSFNSPEFRASILESDICTIDGVPLLWIGRLMGLPMSETVAGSTLTQNLRDQQFSNSQMTIFFFGGEDGVAEEAISQLSNNQKGLKPVGFCNPGFGEVEELISDEIIQSINKHSPNILLVALGAFKGQTWIRKGRDRLDANIITHLGATINFLAGSVKRAPIWMQQFGVEWVWRILKEPKLFTRYVQDGSAILHWLVSNFWSILNVKRMSEKHRFSDKENDIGIDIVQSEKCVSISFGAKCVYDSWSNHKDLLPKICFENVDVVLDFEKTEYIDNRSLGKFLLLMKHQKKNSKKFGICNVNPKLDKLLRFNMFNLSLSSFGFPKWVNIK